jgi:hypothetical protein
MQIDELRGELATLADEVAPFEGDVGSLHRRARRRRVVGSSLVAFAVVVAAATIVAVNHRDDGRVRVAAGSKEVSPRQLSRIQIVVVPATPDVERTLDASTLVARYARIPAAYRGAANSLFVPQAVVRCALEKNDGFAVQASSPIAEALKTELAGRATVFDTSDTLGADIKLFMKVGAPSSQVESIRTRLESDPDISSIRFVSIADAYSIFKRDFVDQPALVQSTKPSDLPASFRVDVRPGVSVNTVADRYGRLDGVDTAIRMDPNALSLLFTPSSLVGATGTSACTKA